MIKKQRSTERDLYCPSLVHNIHAVCMRLCSEAGAFLVRHRRSRILSEPRSRSQDETLGTVNLHLDKLGDILALCQLYRKISSFLHSLHLSLSSDGTFMETAEHISLPDDCTVGYIVEALLGVSLIRSALFHSHLENLGMVSDIHSQVHTYTHTQTHTLTQTDILICQLSTLLFVVPPFR